jgi:Fe-S-cluster containining protein
LEDRAEELAEFMGHRAFMRMRDGHCAALDVRSEKDGAPDFYCTIYDRRPQICRDLARGSAECAGERNLKPMPPPMG